MFHDPKTTPADDLKNCFNEMADIAKERNERLSDYTAAMLLAHDALATIALNKNTIDPAIIALEAITAITERLSCQKKQ